MHCHGCCADSSSQLPAAAPSASAQVPCSQKLVLTMEPQSYRQFCEAIHNAALKRSIPNICSDVTEWLCTSCMHDAWALLRALTFSVSWLMCDWAMESTLVLKSCVCSALPCKLQRGLTYYDTLPVGTLHRGAVIEQAGAAFGTAHLFACQAQLVGVEGCGVLPLPLHAQTPACNMLA